MPPKKAQRGKHVITRNYWIATDCDWQVGTNVNPFLDLEVEVDDDDDDDDDDEGEEEQGDWLMDFGK